jgi:hypothetical protein
VATTPLAAAGGELTWEHWIDLPSTLDAADLAGPLPDGGLVESDLGGLRLVSDPQAPIGPFFGTAPPRPPKQAWDIALSPGLPVTGAGCSFPAGDVFGLVAGSPVTVVDTGPGGVRTLAAVPGLDSPAGIAFDRSGRFGFRLLVAGRRASATAVRAVDCAGKVTSITDSAPLMEGGMEVAPPTFGAFGGQLVGPDELSGALVAVSAEGVAQQLVVAVLPGGRDAGPESVGFVPPGFTAGGAAYLAAGGSLLRLSASDLATAGVRDGDLLVAGAGGTTVDVRCAADGGCARVGPVARANGSPVDGHLLLVADHPGPTPLPLPPGRLGVAAQGGLAFLLPYAVGVVILAALYLLDRRQTRRRL